MVVPATAAVRRFDEHGCRDDGVAELVDDAAGYSGAAPKPDFHALGARVDGGLSAGKTRLRGHDAVAPRRNRKREPSIPIGHGHDALAAASVGDYAGVSDRIPGFVGDDTAGDGGLRPRSGPRGHEQEERQNRVLHGGSDEPDRRLDASILASRQPAASFLATVIRPGRPAAATAERIVWTLSRLAPHVAARQTDSALPLGRRPWPAELDDAGLDLLSNSRRAPGSSKRRISMLRLLASLALVAAFAAQPAAQSRAESRRHPDRGKAGGGAPSTSTRRPPPSSRNFRASARRSPPGSSSTAQKNGPFKKVEELMNVQGIGEKSFLQFRSQLTVGADRPLNASGRAGLEGPPFTHRGHRALRQRIHVHRASVRRLHSSRCSAQRRLRNFLPASTNGGRAALSATCPAACIRHEWKRRSGTPIRPSDSSRAGSTYEYFTVVDGNRNGVRVADVQGGVDRPASHGTPGRQVRRASTSGRSQGCRRSIRPARRRAPTHPSRNERHGHVYSPRARRRPAACTSAAAATCSTCVRMFAETGKIRILRYLPGHTAMEATMTTMVPAIAVSGERRRARAPSGNTASNGRRIRPGREAAVIDVSAGGILDRNAPPVAARHNHRAAAVDRRRMHGDSRARAAQRRGVSPHGRVVVPGRDCVRSTAALP